VSQSSATASAEQLVRIEGKTVTMTPLSTGQDCSQLAVSTPTALLLACGQGAGGGGMGERSLLGSADSGRTFLPLPDPGEGAGYDGSGIADAGNGYAVIATSSSNRSALLSTSDGARTWHESLSFTGEQYGEGFGDLGFEDATHGVVIVSPAAGAGEQPPFGQPASAGQGTLYRTTDRGASWTRIVF